MAGASITGFCPQGGAFYVCQGNATQFLGCCAEDPCAGGRGDCPRAALRYTSYNADDYAAIPPEACAAAGLWYTCATIDTAFMGCCLGNPCRDNGCAQADLAAARLSDVAGDADPFMTPSSSAAAAAATPALGSGSHGARAGLSTGAIVGVSLGASLGALLAGVLLFLFCRRRARRRAQRRDEFHQPEPDGTPGAHMPSPYQDSTGFPSPQFPHPAGQMYGADKTAGSWHGQVPTQQRPMSTAPSWLSGGYSGHGRTPSDHPSVSSMASSQGGLNLLYNQHRPPPQYLNAVAEADGVELARPPASELAGSQPQGAGDHVYGPGYSRIATREEPS